MIHTISVKCSAHDADIKLDSLFAYEGSLLSLRIIDVPKKIGKWDITNVYFTFQNGNEIVSKECVKTNGVWVTTTDSVAEPMTSWYRISAKGTDENGETVEAYNLGQGDITILDTDGTIHVDGTEYYVHLLDALPEVPKKGDLVYEDGSWQIYDGNEWKSLRSVLPVATPNALGGIKATASYITLTEDGDIASLSANFAYTTWHATTSDNATEALTAETALTANHSLTAEYALTANSASTADSALTADNATYAQSAGYATDSQNASWAQWSQGCDMANDVSESSTTLQKYVTLVHFNETIGNLSSIIHNM